MELITAFLLGLVGSLHCAGMCGPLVLALPTPGGSRGTDVAGRLVYHVGRLLTYAALGVTFGLAGRGLVLAGYQRWLSIAAGTAIIGGYFLARYLPLTALPMQVLTWFRGGFRYLLSRPSLVGFGLLGGLNGLLPCGLVYVACAGAVATGSWVRGGTYMVCFGIGTVPMLLAIGFAGGRLQQVIRLRLSRLIPLCLIGVGGLLILRGLSLGIPYVSPNLDAAEKSSMACPCGE